MLIADLPFSPWEAALFAFLNAFPYMVLVLHAFRPHWRFGRGVTLALLLLITLVQMGGTLLRLFTSVAQNPIFDLLLSLLYVAFIPLIIRDHLGKLVFTVLVMMDLGNLVVVLGKCVEGQLFPALALLRYHVTYSLTMIPVELILLPVIYLTILRGICAGDGKEERSEGERYMWRYLWLVPAVFYLIWMQHFYASGRSALENALDPVSTVYLLLIDAGSVLIYRVIIQLERTLGKNRRLMAENHALTLQSVQYDNLRKRMEETRRARHDLRHHVMLLRSIRSSGDFSALDELLEGYPDLESLERPLLYCENEIVNAILAHFWDQAAEKGVSYTVRLDLPEEIFVEKTDLAVLFGNLLENAVEAAAQGEGTGSVSVSGSVTRRNGVCDSFALTVENSCAETPSQNKKGVFLSTKHEGEGIGVESVRSITERYGGVSSFAAKDGTFTASLLLYPQAAKEPGGKSGSR